MMREFEEGGIAGREDILEAFAAFTVDLHKKGVLHLDYSAGNILFDKQEEGIVFSINRPEPYAVYTDDSENVLSQFQPILSGRVGRAICRRGVCPFTRVGRGYFHRGGFASA